MKLSKAVALQIEYGTIFDSIKVDNNGFICLNDMEKFFPHKRLDNWLRLDSTSEFINIIENIEKRLLANTSDVRDLNNNHNNQFKALLTKRGNKGGTWAHKDLAFEFAMWLSPEFKLHVIRSYQNGTQRKQDWNVKRILAASNFKLMTDNLKSSREEEGKETKFYHYSNEALMLNEIVFGVRESDVRDTATEAQLDAISKLEGHNATLLALKWEYSQRKETLISIYQKDIMPKLSSFVSEL